MIYNNYGNTDIKVSKLGYGAGHIGREELDEDFVGSLLNEIVNLGINLIDTARGYNKSEERIGRHLSWRRKEIVLSTKVGYGVDGYKDWTYDCILKGVELAMKKMQTDYIDIVHLHSCEIDILKQSEVIEALRRCKDEQIIKAVAYSGENEALSYAVEHNLFDGIECSVNLFDQRVIDNQLKIAKENGIGVIAKRPLANVPWRFKERPLNNYCEEYWIRMKKMGFDNYVGNITEEALRFSAFANGVSSSIVGSLNLDHIKNNLKAVMEGKLDIDKLNAITNIFKDNDKNWIGQV